MDREIAWLLAEKYNGEKSAGFFADCEHLKAGEPLAYIIGSIPFLDCEIFLDSHPLIPRPETEFWVEQFVKQLQAKLIRVLPSCPSQTHPTQVASSLALSADASNLQSTLKRYLMILGRTLRKSPPKRLSRELDSCLLKSETNSAQAHILDLCAGSGCIGVAIQHALPATQVDFAEIDSAHLPTTQKNLTANTKGQENKIFQSDLFENVSGKYHYIVTNPPYIDPALDRTDSSVKLHEPHLALYGGQKGLELIELLIEQASDHLYPSGQLWIEHEPEQSTIIQELAKQSGFTATTHLDQYNVERYSVLVLQ